MQDYQKQIFSSCTKQNLESYYYAPYNEVYKVGAEQMLNEGRLEEYYSRLDRYYQLYEREDKDSIAPVAIATQQLIALKELKQLMDNGHTSYRIIISPLYNQIQLNPTDITQLQNIFGKECVFNFSGKNQWTDNVLNFYEVSHYRPRVCRELIDSVYLNFNY